VSPTQHAALTIIYNKLACTCKSQAVVKKVHEVNTRKA